MSNFEIKSVVRVFGGTLTRFTHQSNATKTPMTCAVYLPSSVASTAPSSTHPAETTTTVPYIVYLSGLTCTDENVCQKGAPFAHLARHQIGFVAPDTSPRSHPAIPGESDSWDFGLGAGFYVDATKPPYNTNYNMYTYIVHELPDVLANFFPALDSGRVGIMGHSMGGHGALTIALKNPASAGATAGATSGSGSGTACRRQTYSSVSAFAPICQPSQCPWGIKAFSAYLGTDESTRTTVWSEYDACALVSKGTGEIGAAHSSPLYDDILVDVGTADTFLKAGQLQPEAFVAACNTVNQPVTMRLQDGYDHSYYFCSTFIGDHIDHHAARLLKK